MVISEEIKAKILEEWEKNPMRRPRIEKVVVNMGVGQSGERLEKAMKVLEQLTNQKPVKTKARKTIKGFGIRKGEPIGCKVTLRGERAIEFLRKAFAAINNTVKVSSFDEYGNLSFGIKEHIDIPGTKYDPELGVFGMDVCISFERPGYRISRRRRCKRKVPRRHRMTKEEAMVYLMETFGVQIVKG
ncbi:MAG: 50S ribosomal protein L5 [Candidatus Baldrarchaeia archaeon]